MTAIKDALELPKYIKTVLVAIILLSPFWYLDIRLFELDYKFTNSIELPIIFAFCLTVLHLFLNYFLVFLVQQSFGKNAGSKIDDPIYMFLWILLLSIPVLAFLSYLFFLRQYSFFYLVTTIYSLTGGFIIIFLAKTIICKDFIYKDS